MPLRGVAVQELGAAAACAGPIAHTGVPQGAAFLCWLLGALPLQRPRLKVLGRARINIVLDFSWVVSCLTSQSQRPFVASGNGTYAAGLALILAAFGSAS